MPCHTSIEHPWFREHPEYYIWADSPANNWMAAFGGTAWQRDEVTGRYYLHSFFPEQADLNWREPRVREAMAAALRFWRDRGVDGFRLDAIDRLLKDAGLRDDPPATEPFALPLHEEYARLAHVRSANVPDIGLGLEVIRRAVGHAWLVGEAYLPTAEVGPYLEALDVVFAFEAMNAGPDAGRLRATIEEALGVGRFGWVLSNHDFPRFASRFGPAARAGALLFLGLPGPVFVFQGDEIGMPNGPGAAPPLDRTGRDAYRHPMQWDATETGGFSTGRPWLPAVDPASRNVADQNADPASVLHLFRRAIALRRDLGPEMRFLDAPDGVVMYERGRYVIAANFGASPVSVRQPGALVLEASPGDGVDPLRLPPYGAWIAAR